MEIHEVLSFYSKFPDLFRANVRFYTRQWFLQLLY